MSEKGSERRNESIDKVPADASMEDAPVAMKGEVAYGGEETLPPPPTLTKEEEAALFRKIDWRLMPILTLMYLCSFLDRGNIGEWLSRDSHGPG